MDETAIRWGEYQAYICDMDGTLYYQRRMRVQMLWKMVCYYLRHLRRWREIFVIRDYRKLREREEILKCADHEKQIRNILTDRYHMSEEQIGDLLRFWMFEAPLPVINTCGDGSLKQLLEAQRRAGKRVFIYSDYPAWEKAEALGLTVDGCYSPDGERIRYLKPDSRGLLEILKEQDLAPGEVLFIGDRFEKDVLCARGAGVDSLLLKRTRGQRERQYRKMGLTK